MEKSTHIKKLTSGKPAYFLILLGIFSILLCSITFSLKSIFFNPNKMSQAFNQTNISKEMANQMNHHIMDSIKLPSDRLTIITPNMIEHDFYEIISNGYHTSELEISNQTLNRQVKQSLSNNGIKSDVLNTLIDQVSPAITDKFNVEIDTADNRQYLRNLLLAKQINQVLMVIGIVIIVTGLVLAIWRHAFLNVLGWSGIWAGLCGLLITIWLQRPLNSSHFFANSEWQPLMHQMQLMIFSKWQLMAWIELGVGLICLIGSILHRRWLS